MPKNTEEILGIDVLGSKRAIPGSVPIEGREHWYIEDDGTGDFDSLFLRIVSAIKPPRHTRGGALTGGCELTLPDGRKFHAMSYKGDLEGWREQIDEGTRSLGLDAARAVNGNLILSGGAEISISACEARFY
jgi:hypothetical protein